MLSRFVSRRAIVLSGLAGAVVAVASGASAAHAATFCVNKSPCLLGTPMPTIQAALGAAAANGEEDTVRIGANGGTPYAESVEYIDNETVHIVGDGVGQTIIQGQAATPHAFTLLNPSSTIESLTIRAPDVAGASALVWNAAATEIEAVHLGSPATNVNGLWASGPATLADSTVRVNGFKLMHVQGSTSVVVRDSTLVGGNLGIGATGSEHLTVSRSSVTAARSPIQIGGGPSTLNVDNSVLRMTGTAGGDGGISAIGDSNVVVRHATIVGANGGAGVYPHAISGPNTVTIFDSIIDNFQFALRCFGEPGNTTTMTVTYSNWTDPTEVDDAECNESIAAPSNDTTTVPGFVGANSLVPNYRLKAPSPLIDAATHPDPLSLDIVRAPRMVDGDGVGGARSDMGAYEYQRQAPHASITAPATATIGVPAAFSAAGSGDPDAGDVLTFTWDFGDGGSATGLAPTHAFAAAGTRTVTVTVTDPTGLSATASASVEVPGPPANPPVSAPNTSITSAPTKGQLRKRRAKFLFQASEPGAGFECSLDGKPFAACTSPKTYKRLKPGKHLFAVRAIGAGGADPSPAEKRFKVKRPRR